MGPPNNVGAAELEASPNTDFLVPSNNEEAVVAVDDPPNTDAALDPELLLLNADEELLGVGVADLPPKTEEAPELPQNTELIELPPKTEAVVVEPPPNTEAVVVELPPKTDELIESLLVALVLFPNESVLVEDSPKLAELPPNTELFPDVEAEVTL